MKASGWSLGITEGMWVKRLNGLQNPVVRGKIASIVMWDHFGNLPEAPASIKDMANVQNGNCLPEQVAQGLIAVGYPPDIAMDRANVQRQSVVSDSAPMDMTEEDDEVSRVKNGCRRLAGEHSLLCGICEQSIDDIRSLVAADVILPSGTIRDNWPPTMTRTKKNGEIKVQAAKGFNGIAGYTSRAEVQDLLDFVLKGDLLHSMRIAGVNTDFDKILKEVFRKTVKPAKPAQDVEDREPIKLSKEVA